MDEAPNRLADAAAALDHAAAQKRAGEVAECLAIAALCDLHHVDDTILFEGAERWVQGGADGTPQIGEFIAAEIAGILEVSIGAAFHQIATVLNLRHRHPRLWRAIITGTVRVWQAAQVAKACDAAGLSPQACLQLDRHCAIALAQQPFGRVMGQLDGWIILADPAAAAERERRAAARRHVSFGQLKDGHVPVWAQLDAADGLALDDALTGIADALPDPDRDANRAAALGILARHALGQEPLPLPDHAADCGPTLPRRPVEVVVQLTGSTATRGPSRPTTPGPTWRPRRPRARLGTPTRRHTSPAPSPAARSPSARHRHPTASPRSTATRSPHRCGERWKPASPSTPSPTAPATPAPATPTTRSPSTTHRDRHRADPPVQPRAPVPLHPPPQDPRRLAPRTTPTRPPAVDLAPGLPLPRHPRRDGDDRSATTHRSPLVDQRTPRPRPRTA